MNRFRPLALTALMLLSFSSLAVNAEEAAPGGEIVVYVNSGADTSSLSVLSQESENVMVVKESELPDLRRMAAEGEVVAYGEPQKYQATVTPNDPGYSGQWAPSKIEAPGAWDIITGDQATIIAILDTGFMLNHPDLSSKFIAGYDYVDGDEDPGLPAGGGERFYHGTMVAGAAAASTNNGVGIAGVDWNAKIMPIRVMDNDGGGYTDDIAAGIDYARTHGADVINMSLGYHPDLGEAPDTVLEAAINNAHAAGVTVVAASGNEDREISYPAAYSNVIAVGATDEGDSRCDPSDWGSGSGSNYGPELDVVAPGNNIYTTAVTWNGSSYVAGYIDSSGTSLATPIVSGIAALLKGQGEYLPAEIRSFIIGNTNKVSGMGGASFTTEYGYGRINAKKTVEQFSVSRLSVTPVTFTLGSTKIVGQNMGANFTLTNNNIAPVLISRLKIDIRGTGDSQDIAGGSGLTVNPGETIVFGSLQSSRYLSDDGSYLARIMIQVGGTWRQLGSTKNLSVRNPRNSDFGYGPVLSLSPNPVTRGGQLRARYTITNRTAGDFMLSRGKLNVRGVKYSQDITGYSNRALSGGAVFNFDQSRVINYRDLYQCTAAINIFGRWVIFYPATSLRTR